MMGRREMERGVDCCRDLRRGDPKLGMGALWLVKLLSLGMRTIRSAIVWARRDTVVGRGPKLISICEYGCNWACTIELRLGVSIVLGCEYINVFFSIVVSVVDLVHECYTICNVLNA